MKGWLIYDEQGAERNGWFIRRLQAECARHGAELSLKLSHELTDDLPDFAIVRTIEPELNAALEKKGVRVFNNARTAKTACDKWETYLACKQWGIPVLDTYESYNGEATPLVVKARRGHGGTQVFWMEDGREAKAYGKEYLFQRPNGILGKDMRVYAIGGEIVASVLRTARSGFKSNYSLGGSVCLAQADEEQKQIVKTLYEKLSFDFVGIDFLPTESGWVLNEIEDSAGTRMLYQCSDIDVIPLYIEHVLKG